MSSYEKIQDLLTININEVKYVQGIPWGFKKAEEKFLEWCGKTKNYFSFEESSLAHQQNLLNQNQIHTASKHRIQQYIKDKHFHLKQMKKILKDFIDDSKATNLVDNQNILSYQNNIFRDWCWGQEENFQYSNYIQSQITETTKNILVLGAGACGLSYELAKNNNARVVSIDINPYLLLTANKIFNNKHIKLYEFIDYPQSSENISIKREIKPINKDLSNHYLLFGDFEDLPFKENSFDLIVGCWFYDIIPYQLEESLLHSNFYLKDNGKNIFIGPSNFHKKNVEERLTSSEILSTYESLFTTQSSESKQISYLDNPKNSFKRLENVLFLTAQSPKDSKKIATNDQVDDFIHPTAELLAYKQKNEIFYRILKYIDRPITYAALAKELEKEFNFSSEEAKFYAYNFIQKLNLEIN